ncbi:SusC/RagA family TonB-linked outer membrane protein [Fodinibius salsisoli]|uniref:SusC/RagA family TonB-linked outer membrane protein n=1 Tax=Fodinibius salsisoli TaxID=2820877 RepID=A0ABT3PSI0_9BACT|nr:SusC/RagA family TonB-linked outer membrane protein [Fodinibius salsisoli]MCW9708801.1 SusC/RagA family TonB-linked outer membrane protein [Fodinibius salsisoli]
MKKAIRKAILYMSIRGLIGCMLICVTANILLAHEGAAQDIEDVIIDISITDASVEGLFTHIEDKTTFLFLYDKRKVDKNRQRFSLHQDQISVAEILEKITAKTGFSFQQVNKSIAVNTGSSSDSISESPQLASKTIRGTVTDAETGEPLPGVNITVPQTSIGTSSNSSGEYELTVPDETTSLKFSFIGFVEQEVKLEGRTTIDIALQPDVSQLSEVVVTALGISRETRSLGYSVGEVSGEDVATTSLENVTSGLAGRVAGVTMNQTSGVGSSVSVVIRGLTSLTTDNQPLYVIDGVPMSSGLNNISGMGDGNEVDYGNAISDLNPADIEDMTVLKGPSAAALYGSRAANGVVLITTKQGKEGEPLSVSFSSSNVFERSVKFLDFHYQYATGSRTGILDESSNYWAGPELDAGNTAVQWNSPLDENGNPMPMELQSHPDNMKNFLETGFTTSNNISLSGSTDDAVYRFSFNNMLHNGMIPNSNLKRNTFSSDYKRSILPNVSLDVNVNYSRSSSDDRPSTASRDANPLEAVYTIPHSNITDMEQYWQEGRQGIQQRSFDPGKDNPYFLAYGINNRFNRDRIYGNVRLDWQMLDGLSAFGRLSLNSRDETRETKIPWSYTGMEQGGYFYNELGGEEVNTDFLVTYETRVDDFDFSVSGGGNYMVRTSESVNSGTNNDDRGLEVPNLYRISNIPSEVLSVNNYSSKKKIYSLYSTASIGFKDQLYLDLTARNDWSSTLPADNRSYFYPSASISWLAQETLQLPSAVSMLKLRGGWAQVGNDANPYQLEPSLGVGNLPGFGLPSISTPSTLLNPNLKPEIATSIEGGLDLALFDNRLRFEGTYYQVENKNQILNINTPASSGATSRLINAGILESKGLELSLGATPIQTKDWMWDFQVNFSRNRTTLVELDDELDRLQLWGENGGGAYTEVGEEIGNLYSSGYARVEDPSSEYYNWPILDSNGYWQELSDPDDRVKVGNFNPRGIVGAQTTVSYKRFTLSANIDWRIGGEFMSFTYRYGESDWKSQRQIDNLIPGGLRDPEALAELLKSDPERYIIPRNGNFPRVGGYTEETGGYYVDEGAPGYDGGFIPGVQLVDGEYVEHLGGEETNFRPISTLYPWDFNQQVTFDASFIKLRDITLGYDIPSVPAVESLRVSVYARNLLLWTAAGIGIDPERAFTAETSTRGDTNMMFSQGLEWQNVMPHSVSFGFNLDINF